MSATTLSFGGVLLLVYWTVLVAELVGDKSIYTIASLATRFGRWQVMAGVGAAFALKMLAAVFLGQSLARISGTWLALLSAATFFATAAFLLFRAAETSESGRSRSPWPGAAAISFAAIFFSEWADAGQIAAAVLTAQSKLPLAVWIGAMMALLTKAAVAMILGTKLREALPGLLLRRMAAASCLLLGSVSLARLWWH
ncbi:MAG: TMEM165/GDT1 family protein [Acidobacteriota bacterium]